MDKILAMLENDAKLTPEQLAVMLNKETGDIKRTIKKYEEDGVILGYQALVDWDKTDREYVTAFIEFIDWFFFRNLSIPALGTNCRVAIIRVIHIAIRGWATQATA